MTDRMEALRLRVEQQRVRDDPNSVTTDDYVNLAEVLDRIDSRVEAHRRRIEQFEREAVIEKAQLATAIEIRDRITHQLERVDGVPRERTVTIKVIPDPHTGEPIIAAQAGPGAPSDTSLEIGIAIVCTECDGGCMMGDKVCGHCGRALPQEAPKG